MASSSPQICFLARDRELPFKRDSRLLKTSVNSLYPTRAPLVSWTASTEFLISMSPVTISPAKSSSPVDISK